jgi:hypothetical protein
MLCAAKEADIGILLDGVSELINAHEEWEISGIKRLRVFGGHDSYGRHVSPSYAM